PGLAGTRDERGLSAYLLAHLGGHAEIVGLLAASGLELDVVESVFAEDWKRFEALVAADPGLCRALHPIGGTPLYGAALAGESDDLYRLRGAGCRPDEAPAGGSGFTPARAAMECRTLSGALIAATDLLANGGDANATQRGGDSILHGAVRRRDERLVRLAIRKGAHIAALDAEGRSARALAAQLGWAEGVALLDADAEGRARLPRDHRRSRFAFDGGGAPLERPVLAGVPQELQNKVTGGSHNNLGAVRALVDADPRLTFSLSTDDELAIEASAHMGNRAIMQYHLEQGAPLSLPTAVSLGDVAAVERLLDWDPRLVHERGAHDFPVLYYVALGGGGPAMAERLVARGVELDQESQGATTLHLCVRSDDTELAEWLIARGCALEPLGYRWNPSGETPLALARQEGRKRIVELLEKAGAKS
ncbi:MAG: hypothetical protein HOP15_07545, partial [Planctomycetes bacterium]|nr:hypothetical protein [Planctomycetota bacterium]